MTRYLTEISNNKDHKLINHLKQINDEEFKNIKFYTKIIDEFEETLDLFTIVFNNYKDFLDSQEPLFQELATSLKDPLYLDRKVYTKIKVEINRKVLNYLGTFRMFIDYLDRKIKTRFGNNSKEFTEFKTLQSFLYDNYFEYRFIYKLRNYCQHCSLPVSEFSIGNNLKIIALSILFNRDHLINDYDSWGIVKNDLQKLEEKFSVSDILHNHINLTIEISKKADELYEDKIRDAVKFLNTYRILYRNKLNEIVITTDLHSAHNEKKNLTFDRFPFHFIDKYLEK